MFTQQQPAAFCFPSRFSDFSGPRTSKWVLLCLKSHFGALLRGLFLDHGLLQESGRCRVVLGGVVGGGIKEEACMMPFCPEAGNSHERFDQTLQLPQKSNFGSNQESLKQDGPAAAAACGSSSSVTSCTEVLERAGGRCSNPKLTSWMEAV